MKRLMFFVSLIISSCTGISQEYRVVYDASTLPELYDQTNIYVEQKQGGDFRRLPANKYKLSATGAELKGSQLSWNKAALYRNKGVLDMNLRIDGRDMPVKLALPVLEEIRINAYTDSIKPILNYYLNVEGKFTNGKVYPLDAGYVTVTADNGTMKGLEWVAPKERNFEKVNFTVTNRFEPADVKTITLYLKKFKDPRDDINYKDKTEEEIINEGRSRR